MAHRNFFPSNTPDTDDDHLQNDFNPDRRLTHESGPLAFQPTDNLGFHSGSYPGPAIPARPTDYPSSSSGIIPHYHRPSPAGTSEGPMMGRYDQPHPKPWHWDPDPSHPRHLWPRHGPGWYPSHPVASAPPGWFGRSGPSHGTAGYPGSAFVRHPRSLSMSGGRIGRARLPCGRFQPYPTTGEPNRAPETLTVYDQHRDLRLDVDSMTYEELLDLGERIGSVSTGLTEEALSKSLKRSLFSDPRPGGQAIRCVICLDRYEDGDELAMLRCGHEFHCRCVTTWLRIKNACPICKAQAAL
ncbi:uncharacterized protein LOC144705966 [Wolffia australiana]